MDMKINSSMQIIKQQLITTITIQCPAIMLHPLEILMLTASLL